MDDRFVNVGEEVILTLLWQSGASESATVCFVISLSICYWLLKCRVLRVVCVSVWVREGRSVVCVWVCECVCVCVWVSEWVSEWVRGSQRSVEWVSEWVRETWSHNRSLCIANTYELHHCVCHTTPFPSQAWTDGKTKDIINCLYIYFES